MTQPPPQDQNPPQGASPGAAQPDLSIRARPPQPRRLSRRVLASAALMAGLLVAFALYVGLSVRPTSITRAAPEEVSAAAPPETITKAAANYDAADLPAGQRSLAPPTDPIWGQIGPPPQLESSTGASGPPSSAGYSQGSVVTPPPPDPETLARSAPIFFSAAGGGGAAGVQASASAMASAPGARSAFLASQRADDDRLDAELKPPASRYTLIAGSVVPAALVTELNSDLPGRVIAQVTSNVYDSVTGDHLLIPQGARLLGTYDSGTSYGDSRVLLVWNRLIFPNGWSISLRGMEATDPAGAAGLKDRTDYHADRLLGAIAGSAIISVISRNAEGENTNDNVRRFGDAAAAEAARTGSRIIDRELNVRPTLRIRAGGAVRLLVTRDIPLKRYAAP